MCISVVSVSPIDSFNEKWIWFSILFFFCQRCEKRPWNNPRGICSFSWASPQSLMYDCFLLMYPSVSREWERGLAASCSCCSWGWARQKQKVLEMAALKDAGGIGGFPFQRQSSPWSAGFYSPGVAGTAFLKAAFLLLPGKEGFIPRLWREQQGSNRSLLGIFAPYIVTKMIQKLTRQNQFFSLIFGGPVKSSMKPCMDIMYLSQ